MLDLSIDNITENSTLNFFFFKVSRLTRNTIRFYGLHRYISTLKGTPHIALPSPAPNRDTEDIDTLMWCTFWFIDWFIPFYSHRWAAIGAIRCQSSFRGDCTYKVSARHANSVLFKLINDGRRSRWKSCTHWFKWNKRRDKISHLAIRHLDHSSSLLLAFHRIPH